MLEPLRLVIYLIVDVMLMTQNVDTGKYTYVAPYSSSYVIMFHRISMGIFDAVKDCVWIFTDSLDIYYYQI